MIESLELRKPVLIDGEKTYVLTYDVEKITPQQFIEAEVLAGSIAASTGKFAAKVFEIDAGYHYYLGVMAVLAANPGYAVEDVERVKGPDILKLMRVGRNFMTEGAEEEEDEDFAPDEEEELEEFEDEEPDEDEEEDQESDLPVPLFLQETDDPEQAYLRARA